MEKSDFDINDVLEFLQHSNWIERETSSEAFDDAVEAWNYAKEIKKMGTVEIRNIHRILMKRLRPDIAGRWRDCDVYIGGVRKRFIHEALIEAQVRQICSLIEMSNKIPGDLDKYTRKMHIEFEGVHPFEDGNGRVGRILYNWHRMTLGLPIHIIHEGAEQMEYYKWFAE